MPRLTKEQQIMQREGIAIELATELSNSKAARKYSRAPSVRAKTLAQYDPKLSVVDETLAEIAGYLLQCFQHQDRVLRNETRIDYSQYFERTKKTIEGSGKRPVPSNDAILFQFIEDMALKKAGLSPDVNLLVKKTGYSRSTVTRTLRQLYNYGLLGRSYRRPYSYRSVLKRRGALQEILLLSKH